MSDVSTFLDLPEPLPALRVKEGTLLRLKRGNRVAVVLVSDGAPPEVFARANKKL